LAKNTDDGYRKGEVENRSQTHNPKTDSWVERDNINIIIAFEEIC